MLSLNDSGEKSLSYRIFISGNLYVVPMIGYTALRATKDGCSRPMDVFDLGGHPISRKLLQHYSQQGVQLLVQKTSSTNFTK